MSARRIETARSRTCALNKAEAAAERYAEEPELALVERCPRQQGTTRRSRSMRHRDLDAPPPPCRRDHRVAIGMMTITTATGRVIVIIADTPPAAAIACGTERLRRRPRITDKLSATQPKKASDRMLFS